MDDRRYYGLDALRGGMMMLGIVLHSATLYLASPPPHIPLTTDRNTSYLMDLLFNFIHSFRMPTFFVLAGFFASLLVEKRGLWGTYKNRVARIVGPLVAGMFTVLPLSMLFMLDFMVSVKFGTHDILPSRDDLAKIEREARAQGIPSSRRRRCRLRRVSRGAQVFGGSSRAHGGHRVDHAPTGLRGNRGKGKTGRAGQAREKESQQEQIGRKRRRVSASGSIVPRPGAGGNRARSAIVF